MPAKGSNAGSYFRNVPSSTFRAIAPDLGWLDIELTERCNFHCRHCYICRPADDAAAREREMSTAMIRDILEQAAALGIFTVRFTGGEPLLRPDFTELYLHARRQGLGVLLYTNASLITPEIADLLTRIPPREPLEISIYGMSPASCLAVTGQANAYQAVRRGVELLQARKIPFVVKTALLPDNRDELDAFHVWAATLPGMAHSPGTSMQFDLRGRRDDEVKNASIRTLRPSPGDTIALLARDRAQYLREMRRFCGSFIGPPGDRLFRCGAGHNPCVDAYGRVQLCLLLRAPECTADLRDTPLREALHEVFPALQSLRATNPDYLARCARCFLKGLCNQCPAKSWSEHGTLDTPVEYLCELAHAQAVDMGLLADGEYGWEVADWRECVARFVAEEVLLPV